ncbi:MAG: hypothetical protein RR614_01550 [Eubacterium sp.]
MGGKSKQGMSVGVIALITIFIVFLLVCLAVLSLNTASANRRTTEKSITAQNDYYTADKKAQEKLKQLHEMMKMQGITAETAGTLDESMDYDPNTQNVMFSTTINATSEIQSKIHLEADGTYTVTEWKTVNTAEWKTDNTTNNLWKGN